MIYFHCIEMQLQTINNVSAGDVTYSETATFRNVPQVSITAYNRLRVYGHSKDDALAVAKKEFALLAN